MGTIPMGGRGARDIGIAMAMAAPAVGAAEAAHAVGAEAARRRPALLHLGRGGPWFRGQGSGTGRTCCRGMETHGAEGTGAAAASHAAPAGGTTATTDLL